MKTINSIQASSISDDGKSAVAVPKVFIRGKLTDAPFRRQVRHAADGIYVESTAGGKVFIPWSVLESCDSKLCIPKPVDAQPKQA